MKFKISLSSKDLYERASEMSDTLGISSLSLKYPDLKVLFSSMDIKILESDDFTEHIQELLPSFLELRNLDTMDLAYATSIWNNREDVVPFKQVKFEMKYV